MSYKNGLVHLFVALVLWFVLDVNEHLNKTRPPLVGRLYRIVLVTFLLTIIFYNREVFP